MTDKFAHLHNHFNYSLLDGFMDIGETLEKCEELNMPAIAMTDHGTMAGTIDFYSKAIETNVKPIIGVECYMVEDMTLREKQTMNHVTLLARNNEGYKNLLAIVSESNFKGFYYKPRIDMSLLWEHSDGLIILTGCNGGGLVSRNLKKGELGPAIDYIDQLQQMAPTYLEVQYHGIPDQLKVLDALPALCKSTDIPLVITNDCHYLDVSDEKYHDALLAIQTKQQIWSPERFRFASKEFYLKTREEMFDNFYGIWPFGNKELSEALDNTLKIADMCNVEIELGTLHYPKHKSENPDAELKKRIKAGLKKRELVASEVKNRLDIEYDTICEMGFASYFLILSDFVDWCKRNDVIVGPGRGSVVGSFVSFVLGITEVDPMQYGLLFERFLNSARFSPPDIDIDVSQDKREMVFHYLEEEYGRKNVAQILTFGTIGAKAAIKDSARVTGLMPFEEANILTRQIPYGCRLKDAIPGSDDLQQAKAEYPDLFDYALTLEGTIRHKSIHAAGVVIGDCSLTNYLPLISKDGKAVCEADMYAIEKLGLLKIDVLGLRNLDIIHDTVKLIQERSGETIDYTKIPLDDSRVYSTLNDGDTFGIFQVETPGITKTLLEVQPYNIEELAAVIALYRPGPIEMIPFYLDGKRMGFDLGDDVLNRILASTYGVAVYQEQLMEIARDIAGFTLQESDILRKAIGKKDMDIMKRLYQKFFDGASSKGYSDEFTNNLWVLIEKAGNYAFNKSHALGYAVVAMWEAWLKVYHPIEFKTALLNHAKDDNIMRYILEINSGGTKLLDVDINKSKAEFSAQDDGILIGFNALKYVGEGLAEEIVNMRLAVEVTEGGSTWEEPYESLMDFCTRTNPNLNAFRALISCGAFEAMNFGSSRNDMLDVCQDILKESRAAQKRKRSKVPKSIEMAQSGFPVSDNIPLELKYMGFSTTLIAEMPKAGFAPFKQSLAGTSKVSGLISEISEFTTKTGFQMAWVTALDADGEHRLTVFPKQYSKLKTKLEENLHTVVEFSLGKSHNARYGMSLIVNGVK